VVTSVSDPIEESDVSITVESDASEGLAIVRVVGDVDLWSVDDLRKELGQVQPTVSNLIVDLTGVSFIDSTGIGVLVSCLQDVRKAGGRMGLVIAQPHIHRVLQVTNLDQVFIVGNERATVVKLIAEAGE